MACPVPTVEAVIALSIAFVARGAAPLWLPATTRFFARWHLIRHPEIAYAEPIEQARAGAGAVVEFGQAVDADGHLLEIAIQAFANRGRLQRQAIGRDAQPQAIFPVEDVRQFRQLRPG